MAFRQWISRCGGGVAGKLITPCRPPLPPRPRPRLPFTAGSPPPPPPTQQNHHLAPVVVGHPRPVWQAGGNTAPYIEFVDHVAPRLGAAAACGVFFDDERDNRSSRAHRLQRDEDDKRDEDENRVIISDVFSDGEQNMSELPRHAAVGIDLIDVNRRGPVQGGSSSSPILLYYLGGMIGTATAARIRTRTDDVWAFAHRCYGEFSSRGHSIAAASAPSPALLPLRSKFMYGFFLPVPVPPHLLVTGKCSVASSLRRVGASGAGSMAMGGSSGPPLLQQRSLSGLLSGLSYPQHDPMRRVRETRMAPHLYQQRRFMASGRGGFPQRYGPYCQNGRTVLKRPGFLPTQAPDPTAAIKHWKSQTNVDGVVHDSCLDATSLLVKFNPEVYLRTHILIESVPILGEESDKLSWKITEEGKYIIKSLIDLIGTFHDMGTCIAGLSIESLVINSAGKFEFIEGKIEFKVLTEEDVRNNYRTAVSLLEELIVRSMGQEMLAKVPRDIVHLFGLMRTDGYEYRYWIQNHVSLLPLENRSNVFLAFFDYITLYIPNVDTKLKGKFRHYIPYRKIWAIIASSNTYLVEWLKYQDQNGGIAVWGSANQLLHTVRHVIAHKLSLLERGMLYEAEEVEIMLHAHFPMLLVKLQEFFWKEKRLSKFNLEAFFMDKKVTQRWPRHKSEKLS